MRTFSPHDARRLVFVSDAGFVGDGHRGYFCTSSEDGDEDIGNMWIFGHADGGRRQITGRNPRSPRPSPDGGMLAFIADVDGVPQIHTVSVESGDVTAVTGLPQGVAGGLDWSPAGNAIAFTAGPAETRDPSLPYRVTRSTFRYDGLGLIDDAIRDIHVVDLKTGTIRQLTGDRSVNEEPRWSPDAQLILFRTSFPPGDRMWTGAPSAHVIDVVTGERRVVVEEWGSVLAAEWCRDGTRIVFSGAPTVTGALDALARKRDLWVVDVAGGTPICRTENVPAGIGVKLGIDHPTWSTYQRANIRLDRTGDAAYVTAQRGGEVAVYRVGLSGAENVEVVAAGEQRACFLADVETAIGTVMYIASTIQSPPELFVRDGDTERQVSHNNRDLLSDIVTPDARAIEVTAPDGLKFEAWAVTPPGSGPFPTVLAIHGGPSSAYGNVFSLDHQVLVGAGIAVVFANFRGSAGYGTAFMQELHGRWGEVGEQDHHAALDRAIELGIADPERLGVYGLSHGGFATCWLLGRSDRFRAGVAENPLVNFVSAYGTMDIPWFLEQSLGGHPHDDPAAYAERSPLTYASHCTTPLLFIVGENDFRCPPSEAEQYYRALKTKGCQTEMLRLPKGGHVASWIGAPVLRAAQNDALVEWFSRHLIDETARG